MTPPLKRRLVVRASAVNPAMWEPDGFGGRQLRKPAVAMRKGIGDPPLGLGWRAIPNDEHGGVFKPAGDVGLLRWWPSIQAALNACLRYSSMAAEASAQAEERAARGEQGDGRACDSGPFSWRWRDLATDAQRCAEFHAQSLQAQPMAKGTAGKAVSMLVKLQGEVTRQGGAVQAAKFECGGYLFAFRKAGAGGIPILTVTGRDLPMGFHLVVRGYADAVQRAPGVAQKFLDGSLPDEGVFRREAA